MEEIFDIYTRDGKHIGAKEESICHSKNPGFYHKPVWIWIINSKKEVLIQKRTAYMKNHPNKWDMSSAGHVILGETAIQGAIREVYEELGIKTKESDYKFICEYIADKFFEIAQLYLLKLDLDITKLKLQKEEVLEVKWLGYDNFKKVFFSKDFVPFDDDYRELVLKLLKDNFSS